MKKVLKFKPYLKPVIWGGERICQLKGMEAASEPIGESWEISCVPDHLSVVADGSPFAGKTLKELMDTYGDALLGSSVAERFHSFPLLVKIIDANADLSVQVHPDDKLAMQRHDCPGKTEMWYIADCRPESRIYVGLSSPLTPEEYERRVADNSIMDVVAEHKSEPGQFFLVPAGTLHAIGAGNLVVEVQETSDITYRVYDYNRLDASGKPRQLHTDLAKDAIDYRYPNVVEPTARKFEGTCRVMDTDYFSISQLELDENDVVTADTNGESFAIIVVTKGILAVEEPDGSLTEIRRGESALIPASVSPCVLTGKAHALYITA